MPKLSQRKQTMSIPKSMLLSGSVTLAIWILGCALTAILIGAEIIPMQAYKYGNLIVLIISSFVTSKLMLQNKQMNKFLMVGISVLITAGMLLLGNFFICIDGVSGLLPSLLIIVAVALCGLLIRGNTRRKKYTKKYR